MREIPLGVVEAITPGNFPIAISVWRITLALICGNTLIWKPEIASLSDIYLTECSLR